MKSILFVCKENINETTISAWTIRNFELARNLKEYFKTALLCPNSGKNIFDGIKIYNQNETNFIKVFKQYDIIFFQNLRLRWIPYLLFKKKTLIYDNFSLQSIESFELYKKNTAKKREKLHKYTCRKHKILGLISNIIICASERQKDYYLGFLNFNNKLTPLSYKTDKNFSSKIYILPTGIRKDKNPTLTIKTKEKHFLWLSGIWNWFCPKDLIDVFSDITVIYPKVKLTFLGITFNTELNKHLENYKKFIDLAKQKKLLNKNIFFIKERIPYHNITEYIKDFYCGINISPNHLENRFSFRTRFMSFFEANIPIITSNGCVIGDLIEKNNLGLTFNYNDKETLKKHILYLIENETIRNKMSTNINNFKHKFLWQNLCKDFAEYIRSYHHE